jgi:hypothetical protein
MRNHLGEGGPVYEILAEVRLRFDGWLSRRAHAAVEARMQRRPWLIQAILPMVNRMLIWVFFRFSTNPGCSGSDE